MNMNDAALVGQQVRVDRVVNKSYKMLHGSIGGGYRKSMDRNYMGNLREYLLNSQNYDRRRLIFMTDNLQIARYGVGITLNYDRDMYEYMDKDDYVYSSFAKNPDWEEDEQLSAVMIQVKESSETALLLQASGKGKGEVRDNGLPVIDGCIRGADALVFELYSVPNQDDLVEEICNMKTRNIFVSINKSVGYEYIIKRLVFEGNFILIKLGAPTKEDYLKCAMDYVTMKGMSCDEAVLNTMFDDLRIYRKELFEEQDIYQHLNRVVDLARKKGTRQLDDFIAVDYIGVGNTAEEELKKMIGLTQITKIFERNARAKNFLGDRGSLLHGNFIFEGAPGTGKSVTARLLAKRLAELGAANGRFIDCTRSDIIGQFVGHTAPKIRKLFERADGGVLFVDESSFLTADDSFVHEAVTEFVRYMELNPQTTVIFATYPHEGEKLLHVDPGFQSRISRVIVFPEYSEDELYRILEKMMADYGCRLEEDSREMVFDYIRKIQGDADYGSAREMRKLVEACIEECAEDCAEDSISDKNEDKHVVRAEYVQKAISYLMKEKKQHICHNGFGFRAEV